MSKSNSAVNASLDYQSLLEEYLEMAGVPYVSIEEDTSEENVIRFNIHAENPPREIGRQGEHLFAFQHIFRLIVRAKRVEASSEDLRDGPEIIIDIDDYRRNQEENVVLMAKEKIPFLKEQGGTVDFYPMASYKRRAIHSYITENHPEISTESVGVGLDRRLTMSLKS